MKRAVRGVVAFSLLLSLVDLSSPSAQAQSGGPKSCVVADASSVAALLPPSQVPYAPTDVSVDSSGRVVTSWFASTGTIDIGQDEVPILGGEGGVVLHQVSGDSSTIATTLGEIDGRMLGRPFAVAIGSTSNEIFVAERTGDDDRVLRRSATGEWTEVLRRGIIIDTQPYTRAEDLTLMGNGPLYLTQSSLQPDWRRNRVLRVTDELSNELVLGFQSLNGVSAAVDSRPQSVWMVDTKSRRVYQVDAQTSEIAGFDLRFIDTETVDRVDEIGALADAALLSVVMESGEHRLVRLNADGSFTTLLDASTLVAGLAIDSIVGIDVRNNGDIYLADAGNGRVLRLPSNAGSQCVDSFSAPVIDRAGDINCDNETNIIDSLYIVQYDVGVRTSYPGCPLKDPATQINLTNADVNRDGTADVVDALIISQCEVGVPTVACPNG